MGRKRGRAEEVYLECPNCKDNFPVDVRWWYDPGQLSGPPEHYYPPEGEWELVQSLPDDCPICEQDLTEFADYLEQQLDEWWQNLDVMEVVDDGPDH